MSKLERVNFIFNNKCNLACKFCYVPFSGTHYDCNLAFATLIRCKELGARVITFGGGDPYLFPEIDSLLEQADDLGLFVHVDTNGLELKNSNYSKLLAHADLVGFPLDGADSVTHAKMRGSPQNFSVVVNHLRRLKNEAIKIKINTIVTARNERAIHELGSFLCQFRINVWSIYQFWEIDGVTRDNQSFSLQDITFQNIVDSLRTTQFPFQVEPGPAKERQGTYFFVTHYGQVYSSDPRSRNRYNFLGSVFEESTIERWKTLGNSSIRESVKERYF